MLEEERDKLKAFLVAEIRGWKDAIADPEEGARLAVEVYGKDLKLDLPGQVEQLEAQNKLVVTEDTKINGIFTLTPELVSSIIGAIGAVGVTITADELFDLTLLDEIYQAMPELIGN